MEFGNFDGIDTDSSLRDDLHKLHRDYFLSRQQEEGNVSDSDASGDELSDFEATVGDSSHLRSSLLVVGCKEDEEEEAIIQFLEDGCGCNKFNGEPCCQLFHQQSLEEIRSRMLELSSTELDLVVLGQIAAGLFGAELQGSGLRESCATCPVLHSTFVVWNEGQDKLHSFLPLKVSQAQILREQ